MSDEKGFQDKENSRRNQVGRDDDIHARLYLGMALQGYPPGPHFWEYVAPGRSKTFSEEFFSEEYDDAVPGRFASAIDGVLIDWLNSDVPDLQDLRSRLANISDELGELAHRTPPGSVDTPEMAELLQQIVKSISDEILPNQSVREGVKNSIKIVRRKLPGQSIDR